MFSLYTAMSFYPGYQYNAGLSMAPIFPLTWNKNTIYTWRKSDSLTVYKCPMAEVATVITVTCTQVIRKVTIINCQI